MERSNTWAMSPVVRWQRLPVERKLHWLLRVGVIGCFIGDGAYGVLTKEAWVLYFGVVGIDRVWAYRLMPWIGVLDIAVSRLTLTQAVGGFECVLAVAVLVVPLPGLLLSICLWKMATETLFMTSGALPFEWIERAGSYIAPLALYSLVVTRQCRH